MTSSSHDVDGRAHVSVHDSGFGGSFGVTIRITNISSEELTFDGSPMYLTDQKGARLPATLALPCEPSAAQHARPGGTLEFGCTFSARLLRMPDDIVAVQPGLVSGNRPITLPIPMTTRH